ncbi:MAG: DUF2185 domain-containing protein [Eubacteriales bacterium]
MANMNMGGSIVSKNILEGTGQLKWCVRESFVNDVDNGWRFLSDIDTEEYLADASHMVVVGWETLFNIEPAIMPIFDMPIGTELTLVREGNKKRFIYTNMGNECNFSDTKL